VKTFLAHLMVYGSAADVAVVERYVPEEAFREVLEKAPAGVFTQEVWDRWHERMGIKAEPLPRRQFPDGTMGPEAGGFFRAVGCRICFCDISRHGIVSLGFGFESDLCKLDL
jgi:hypothetical protein